MLAIEHGWTLPELRGLRDSGMALYAGGPETADAVEDLIQAMEAPVVQLESVRALRWLVQNDGEDR